MSAIILIPERQVFVTDDAAQHSLGQHAMTPDGRVWRYCEKSGAAAVAGNLQQSSANDANQDELVIVTAPAVGTKTFTYTAQTPTALAANELAEGFVHVGTLTGLGVGPYMIDSNPAIAADTANYTVTLKIGVVVAWDTTTVVDIIKSPFRDVVVSPTTVTGTAAGVAPFAIPANDFGWLQVKGPATCLAEGTLVVGSAVARSVTTAGNVTVYVQTRIEPQIGECMEINATTEHSLVNLAMVGA
mgnify:CR=1 FL=1